jgi:hypothetical protein
MAEYLVTWKIEVAADSPEDAALQALEIQRDPESMATVFDVVDTAEWYQIDVNEV